MISHVHFLSSKLTAAFCHSLFMAPSSSPPSLSPSLFPLPLPLLCSTNVVMNYSEIESKVREATNDDPWGPSGQLMGEIAK